MSMPKLSSKLSILFREKHLEAFLVELTDQTYDTHTDNWRTTREKSIRHTCCQRDFVPHVPDICWTGSGNFILEWCSLEGCTYS